MGTQANPEWLWLSPNAVSRGLVRLDHNAIMWPQEAAIDQGSFDAMDND